MTLELDASSSGDTVDSDSRLKSEQIDWGYTFSAVDAAFPAFEKRETQEFLRKWNLDEFSALRKFRFDQGFQSFQAEKFVGDFLHSAAVHASAPVVSSKQWARMGAVETFDVRVLKCTATSMELFDRLADQDDGQPSVVRASGHIRRCMQDVREGVEFDNELRKLFVDEDSEHASVFADVQDEFLVHLLRWLVLGGALCQWEDELAPYLDVCRELYRDLIAVHKKKGGGIEVGTIALHVQSSDIFARPSPLNSCYLLVDPYKKTVVYFYTAYVPVF